MGKKMLGREILARPVLRREIVDVPAWGGAILLRALSATEAAGFNAYGQTLDPATDPAAAFKLAAWAIVHSWIGEDGAPVLTLDDMPALMDGNATPVINDLGKRVLQLSGLVSDAIASAEKNLESSQSADSGTPSPSPLAAAP